MHEPHTGEQMTQHPTYEHIALMHRGAEALASRLGPAVQAGIDASEAVLVCLGGDDRRALLDALGSHASTVHCLDVDDRYSGPSAAMAAVHRFACEQIERGAPAVWSIGTVPFNDGDRRWARYEAAVDDVLSDLPLRLVCAYDEGRMPPAALETARCTHAVVDEDGERRPSHDYGAQISLLASLPVAPPGAPVLEVGLHEAGVLPVIRRELRRVFDGILDPDGVDRMLLVTTELATNAFLHGSVPARVQAWKHDNRAIIQVIDHGAGLADPYADLRPPPALSIGGYGLWISGQLADAFDHWRDDDGTIVHVEFAARV